MLLPEFYHTHKVNKQLMKAFLQFHLYMVLGVMAAFGMARFRVGIIQKEEVHIDFFGEGEIK